MKPVIAIPSYGRPNSPIFQKLADVNLQKHIYVRAEEVEQYRHNEEYGFDIIPLKGVHCIGSTRAKIVKHLNFFGIRWAFMLDDDVNSLELTSVNHKGLFDVNRLVYEKGGRPFLDQEAFKRWFKVASKHNISLSAPVYRPFSRFDGKDVLYVNCRQPIQCVLINVKDVLEVGNYHTTSDVGAEDIDMIYRLMSAHKDIGVVGNIQYNCPAVGAGKGGNNASEELDLNARYNEYTERFLNTHGRNSDLYTIKTTAQGTNSIKFVWRNWNGRKIEIPTNAE